MTLLSDTHEILKLVADKVDDYKGTLGVKFVGRYDEKILPEYPAIVIIPGGRQKTLHATNTFAIEAQLQLYVYHADLTKTKSQRSQEDLQFVAKLEALLESDPEWKDEDGFPQVIFSFVVSEEPGLIQPLSNKSPSVIGTRLVWGCLSQRRF